MKVKNLLFIVGLVLIFGISGYYLGTKKQGKIPQPTIPATATPIQKACSSEAKVCPDGTSVGRSGPNCEFAVCPSSVITKIQNTNIPQLTFQQILTKYCEKIGDERTYYHAVKSAILPIKINTDAVKIKYIGTDSFACAGENQSGTDYITIQLVDNNRVNLYDKNSKELGHGGPPFLGSFNPVIKTINNIKYSVIMANDGPIFVGTVPVTLRAEKTISLENGEEVFANVNTTIIQANDPRLIEFLNKYSKDDSEGRREIVNYDFYEDMVKTFFQDLTTAENKTKIEELDKILSAFSAY